MLKRYFSSLVLIFSFSINIFPQYTKTANDYVPVNTGGFTFGTNPGWPTNGKWSPEQLANIYAGNAGEGISGIGANSVRATLPDHFLEKWGYGIRIDAYNYYDSLGMKDLTCFIGFPSDEHTDTAYYGSEQSKLFKNMYQDIWDDGENGTPVNDNNYFALYVYKTAMQYGDIIKYWEIWNEPDYTSSSAAYESAGSSDNWWHRAPKPDELDNLSAPFFNYIRLLRISYEVIKYVDEDDYVCLGGIGYESFLDACLRYSDNPDGGQISDSYPNTGGAYFDCVSYHSYPMYFLRKWSNDIGGFEFFRHSDKAVDALLNKKTDFESILSTYKYDGTVFPKKEFIITETNLPAMEFDWYYGSDEMQYNFLMKTIISAQMNGIASLHTYGLYEGRLRSEATNPYHVMGMYRCLSNIEPYSQQRNPSAAACQTSMEMLSGCTYDAEQTAEMQLPEGAGGGAFKSETGQYVYALWAKTKDDKSEYSSVEYTFPSAFKVSSMQIYNWDYSSTQQSETVFGASLTLSGTPLFLHTNSSTTAAFGNDKVEDIQFSPSPVSDHLFVDSKVRGVPLYVEMCTVNSKTVARIYPKTASFEIDMSQYTSGVYLISIFYKSETVQQKILKY